MRSIPLVRLIMTILLMLGGFSAQAETFGLPLGLNPPSNVQAVPSPALKAPQDPNVQPPLYVVAKTYNLVKELHSSPADLELVTSQARRVNFEMDEMGKNYLVFDSTDAMVNQETGARRTEHGTGSCLESKAYWRNAGCSVLRTPSETPAFGSSVALGEPETRPWPYSLIYARPYQCSARRDYDVNGTSLSTSDTYEENTRVLLWIPTTKDHQYKVNVDVAVYGIDPALTSIFSGENPAQLMREERSTLLPSSEIKVANFSRVPGRAYTWEGTIRGGAAQPLMIFASYYKTVRDAQDKRLGNYNCIRFQVWNAKIVADLGD